MPHKRAKRSVREQQQTEKKHDLPPSISTFSGDGVPKSVARVLNAEKVREAWREKKRRAADDTQDGGGSRKKRKADGTNVKEKPAQKGLLIKPGESLGDFNRRVEDDMRPLVRSAMRTSSATARKARSDADREALTLKTSKKTQKTAPNTPETESLDSATTRRKERDGPTEFATLSSSAPKRLNDVAQAPPDLKNLPRGAKANQSVRSKGSGVRMGDGGEGVLSMAQKQMMELEREKVIARYRALKEAKMRAQDETMARSF